MYCAYAQLKSTALAQIWAISPDTTPGYYGSVILNAVNAEEGEEKKRKKKNMLSLFRISEYVGFPVLRSPSPPLSLSLSLSLSRSIATFNNVTSIRKPYKKFILLYIHPIFIKRERERESAVSIISGFSADFQQPLVNIERFNQ